MGIMQIIQRIIVCHARLLANFVQILAFTVVSLVQMDFICTKLTVFLSVPLSFIIQVENV